jgi:hypothetical protein
MMSSAVGEVPTKRSSGSNPIIDLIGWSGILDLEANLSNDSFRTLHLQATIALHRLDTLFWRRIVASSIAPIHVPVPFPVRVPVPLRVPVIVPVRVPVCVTVCALAVYPVNLLVHVSAVRILCVPASVPVRFRVPAHVSVRVPISLPVLELVPVRELSLSVSLSVSMSVSLSVSLSASLPVSMFMSLSMCGQGHRHGNGHGHGQGQECENWLLLYLTSKLRFGSKYSPRCFKFNSLLFDFSLLQNFEAENLLLHRFKSGL